MAIYFVDYENVGSTGIEGIDTLPAGNKVHIFYSVKADTMKMDQVIQLMNVSADVEFHDVTMRGQKNALDFQLIAMLYFTKKDEDTCYIISKDQGYDAAIIFGRKIGAEQVYRRVSINGENIGEVKTPQQTRRSAKRGGESSKPAGFAPQQEQPVLLAERAQGVTTLPYQREYIRPPRKEAPKSAEPVKKEDPKAAEPVKKEDPKAAEPVKKEDPKAAEPVKKEDPKAAEPVKKEEPKAAEPAKKEEPKAAEPAKQDAPKNGIPSFRREVVVVKTVENTGKMQEKAAEPVKKEEPKAVQPAKKEEPKAAEPVKKEEPKTAEPVPAAETEEAGQDAPNMLKAATQWDIFQSSIGGLFDIDIPDEYADEDDEPETAAEPVKPETAAEEHKEEPEKATDQKEEKRSSRSRSRQSRRRSQRQKAEKAESAQKDDTAQAEESKAAEPVKKEEPKAAEPAEKEEPKAAEPAEKEEPKAGKAKKAEGQKKKDKTPRSESPKKGDKDYKEVEIRVKEVMGAAGFTLEPEEYALIAQALVSTSTKNQFYQFFRKTKGEAAGREFYLKIRGQYESLKVLREA